MKRGTQADDSVRVLPSRFDTARLRLRELEAGDESLYIRLYTDPAVMQHVGEPLSPEAAGRAFAGVLRQMRRRPPAAWYWVVCLRADASEVGLLAAMFDDDGASAEFGMMLPAPAHSRGYATETVVTLVEHAFASAGLNRLRTRHLAGHPAVPRILRKLGFTRTEARQGMWHWHLDTGGQAPGGVRRPPFATGGDKG